jgi:hypothetical protein
MIFFMMDVKKGYNWTHEMELQEVNSVWEHVADVMQALA